MSGFVAAKILPRDIACW